MVYSIIFTIFIDYEIKKKYFINYFINYLFRLRIEDVLVSFSVS